MDFNELNKRPKIADLSISMNDLQVRNQPTIQMINENRPSTTTFKRKRINEIPTIISSENITTNLDEQKKPIFFSMTRKNALEKNIFNKKINKDLTKNENISFDSLLFDSRTTKERTPKRAKSPKSDDIKNQDQNPNSAQKILPIKIFPRKENAEEEYKEIVQEGNLLSNSKSKSMIDLSQLFPTGAKFTNKNRYNNVFPTEETRVRLFFKKDPKKKRASKFDDYINANFIFETNKNASSAKPLFIACQAPLPTTFNDFYAMVWQQKTSVIICLTKMVEKGKRKAERYFPERGELDMDFNGIQVSLISQEEHDGFVLRSLKICNLKDDDTKDPNRKKFRVVTHFMFSNWPDFGVPDNCSSLLKLEQLSRFYFQHNVNIVDQNGPMIVHCSAGLGRTGAFIASTLAIRQLLGNPNEKVDIQNIVRHIRKQRHGSVQTKQQYSFIYHFVNQFLSFHHQQQNNNDNNNNSIENNNNNSFDKDNNLSSNSMQITPIIPTILLNDEIHSPNISKSMLSFPIVDNSSSFFLNNTNNNSFIHQVNSTN